MASILKYGMDFLDIYDRNVQVRIYKQNTGGLDPFVRLMPGADPLTIQFKGEDDDPLQTCITSEVKLNCVVEKGSGIADDLLRMKDREYLIVIEMRDQANTLEYRWFGFLIPDNIETDFSYTAGELTISAVCPLSAMKGVQLLDTNGNYYVGLHFLWQFVGGGVLVVLDEWGDVVLPWYGVEILSSLSLSPDETVDVNILEALGCYAETFNKENGRPISCFEAVELCCKALFMRTYFDNGRWWFEDIYDKATTIFSNDLPITYKDHPLTNMDTNALLLGNTEVVTRNESYKETKCSFEYEEVTGLLINGLMNDWVVAGGGYELNGWEPNGALSGSVDYYSRRTGTGRVESPYGIRIVNFSEKLASRTEHAFRANDAAKIDIDLKLLNPTRHVDGGTTIIYKKHLLSFAAIAYNINTPSQSWGIVLDDEGKLAWIPANLTGTTFESGTWDYSVTEINGWIGGGFDITMQHEVQISSVKQTTTIELPALPPFNPSDIDFQVFFRLDGMLSVGYDASTGLLINGASQVVYYNAKLSKVVDSETEGEVTYITRFGKKTISTLEREIQLQTTDNTSIAGAILAMEEYTIDSETFQPGFIQKLYRYGQPWQYNCCLTDINAISMMWMTAANQFKIDMDIKCRRLFFSRRLNMERLYDPSKPFTEMYQYRFLQTRMEWNVKNGTASVTAVSLKVEPKPFDIEFADETRDLLELYKY